MTNAVEYASRLVASPSVSSQSNVPVTRIVESLLRELGFQTEFQEYLDSAGVPKSNVVGKLGTGRGGLAYFAHTDVVPADTWSIREHGAFEPTVKNGRLYGRGSCDMKGSIASFLAAVNRLRVASFREPVYVVCTADEEVGFHGALYLTQHSPFYREMVESQSRVIIGEPTELNVVHAHKGIFGFRAIAHGKAAHSSTRDGINANVLMIPFLAEMKKIHDETLVDPHWLNHAFEPPWISWNIGINDLNCAVNITAPRSICTVFFRPMPGQDGNELIDRARRVADQHGIEFQQELAGHPVFADPHSEYVRETLKVTGHPASRTVGYGTDGVMFTELKQILVLGPGSIEQAHRDDEWISLEQLARGTDLYEQLVRRWCLQ
ncbi:M20 family metallopeptidase [Schlesneria paludicola]|uniref:M20 family metallopeptidase n=1 Tax=Schlesneria paludicola TaxID=360056 RepID=UPI00029B0ADA|nr:M20 family metallopeptidase [Schlesneria paludicola]